MLNDPSHGTPSTRLLPFAHTYTRNAAPESPRCVGNSDLWIARPAESTAQSPLQAVSALRDQLRIAGCRFDGDRLTADLLNHGVASVTDRFGRDVPVTLHARCAMPRSPAGAGRSG